MEAEERRVTEDTKATRETKVKEEMMESMDAKVKMVSLVFPAVKDLPDQTACRETLDQRETLVLTDRKEKKEIPEMTVIQEGLETTAHWDLRVSGALAETTGTKENAVMMAHQDRMEIAARED